MTESEASNMAFELVTRSTMCMAYTVEKKTSASTKLQTLQAKYDEAMKSNKELTLRLTEVEKIAMDDKAKANTLLAKARASHRRLQWSHDGLELDLQHSINKIRELVIEQYNLLAERNTLNNKVLQLENDNKLLVFYNSIVSQESFTSKVNPYL